MDGAVGIKEVPNGRPSDSKARAAPGYTNAGIIGDIVLRSNGIEEPGAFIAFHWFCGKPRRHPDNLAGGHLKQRKRHAIGVEKDRVCLGAMRQNNLRRGPQVFSAREQWAPRYPKKTLLNQIDPCCPCMRFNQQLLFTIDHKMCGSGGRGLIVHEQQTGPPVARINTLRLIHPQYSLQVGHCGVAVMRIRCKTGVR